jgi:hypothetical protein
MSNSYRVVSAAGQWQLARATDFTSEHGADTGSAGVLRLWQRALDAIATGNLDGIAGRSSRAPCRICKN